MRDHFISITGIIAFSLIGIALAMHITSRPIVPAKEAFGQLLACVQETASTPYYGLERLHWQTTQCYRDFMKLNVQESSGEGSVWENFNTCLFHLSNPMYELPPEATTESFRKDMFGCLKLFPSV